MPVEPGRGGRSGGAWSVCWLNDLAASPSASRASASSLPCHLAGGRASNMRGAAAAGNRDRVGDQRSCTTAYAAQPSRTVAAGTPSPAAICRCPCPVAEQCRADHLGAVGPPRQVERRQHDVGDTTRAAPHPVRPQPDLAPAKEPDLSGFGSPSQLDREQLHIRFTHARCERVEVASTRVAAAGVNPVGQLTSIIGRGRAGLWARTWWWAAPVG